MIDQDLFSAVEALLCACEPVEKAQKVQTLYQAWVESPMTERQRLLASPSQSVVVRLESAGRPEHPRLVEAKELPKRGIGSESGRIALLHSLAHIEFNAINLALDAVYRFRQMPVSYVEDWLRVASEEGEHFLLLHHRLEGLNVSYGDLPAHDGLWDMARRTDHDVLVRMALVPRILEARGLDVAPPMIHRLQQVKDFQSAAILERIYTDEITHVEVGNRWFRYVCERRDIDGIEVFRDLLKGVNSGYLQSPYNEEARLKAGFNQAELQLIQEMEKEYKAYKFSSS